MRYFESNRFIVPEGDPAARRYFADCLFVPHRVVERIRRMAGRPPVGPISESSLVAIERLLEMLPPHAPRRRIFLRDYDASNRGRFLAFLFAGDDAVPSVIVKAQRPSASGTLRHEADALRDVRLLLPTELKRTVPEVIHFAASAEGEVLLTTAMPGCSAYVDMQASLTPWRDVERHFHAAARWLAAFHEATAQKAQDDEVPVAASHGDFWARNLLLSRDTVGVVDWEDFRRTAPRCTDLFYFPLTYGLAYPWQRYRRLPAEAAFAKTFLEPNRVSRAVREYLQSYGRLTGMHAEAVKEAFTEFLITSGSTRGAGYHQKEGTLPWSLLLEQYRRSTESVFSG